MRGQFSQRKKFCCCWISAIKGVRFQCHSLKCFTKWMNVPSHLVKFHSTNFTFSVLFCLFCFTSVANVSQTFSIRSFPQPSVSSFPSSSAKRTRSGALGTHGWLVSAEGSFCRDFSHRAFNKQSMLRDCPLQHLPRALPCSKVVFPPQLWIKSVDKLFFLFLWN